MVTKWQNKLQLRNACSCFYPSGSFGQRLCSVKLQVRNTLAIDGRNNQNQNQPNYPAKSHIKASNGPNRPNPSVRVTFCSRRHERSCLCMKLQCRQGFIMMETMEKLNPKCEEVCIRMKSAMVQYSQPVLVHLFWKCNRTYHAFN